MRIAVCENSSAAAQQMRKWIEQFCILYQIPTDIHCFLSAEAFAAREGWFDTAYIGFGGVVGFSQARQLREQDSNCKIVLVDDTRKFAVNAMRLHCVDFILRPVEFRHIVRSMRLVGKAGKR